MYFMSCHLKSAQEKGLESVRLLQEAHDMLGLTDHHALQLDELVQGKVP